MTEPLFAVVSGGGTAGHVLPALSVAEALVAEGHDPSEIHYVGAARGIETRLLPDTPFSASFLDVVGFQRRWSKRNLGFVPKMIGATRQLITLFRDRRPEVVVSVGGYASMPAVFAARRLGIPIVAVSYDLLPGRATQLTAKWAAASAVAFPSSPLARATVTGAPVRQSILDVDRDADRADARRALGVDPDRFLVAVIGGSQGSGALNGAIADLVERWGDDSGLTIRHAVGERFLDSAPPARDGRSGLQYQPLGYEPAMPTVYAAADLLIGRGGASTVHEVAVTGIPAILVPWAAAADNHQAINVEWLADDGAAIHLPEAALAKLGDTISRLRNDPNERTALGAAAFQKGKLHRTGAIARLIESVAAGER